MEKDEAYGERLTLLNDSLVLASVVESGTSTAGNMKMFRLPRLGAAQEPLEYLTGKSEDQV
jgi:hypothetical protein